jgi:methionine sulfoxide reductase heme-binding subunit
MNRRTLRVLRHAGLAAASLALVVLTPRYWDERDGAFVVSMATAYASLMCLTVTLGLGPWHALRGRRLPTSSYLRRDFGIWAALLALVHVGFGLFVHMKGNIWLYFFRSSPHRSLPLPRIDPFGATNDLGLAATLVLIALLALSNNWSLWRLGVARWKAWQRSSYWATAAIALHAAIYQLLERRNWPWLVACWAMFTAIAALQWAARRSAAARARD